MKKSLLLIASSLLLLGSCGGEPASETPASTPEEATATATKTDTKTSTKTNTKTSTSKTSVTSKSQETKEEYYALPFNYFEGSTHSESDVWKWDKGADFKWTFNLPQAYDVVTLYIGAQMSSSSHRSRTLLTNHEGADSSDSFESNAENDGTPRLSVKANGVDYKLSNTATYGDSGLTDSEINYLGVASFPVNAGENVIIMHTHPTAGYRLMVGGDVRLYYAGSKVLPIAEGNPPEPPVTKEFAYEDIQIDEVEGAPVLTFSGSYSGYTAAEMEALPKHFDLESNEWYNHDSWDGFTKYLADSGVFAADEGEWTYKVTIGEEVIAKLGGFIVHFSMDTEEANGYQLPDAFDETTRIGDLDYRLVNWPGAGDDAKKFWGNVALIITDPTVPSFEMTTLTLEATEEKAYTVYTVLYENYTVEEILAIDWQGDWQHNNNIDGKGWDHVDWGNGKDNAFVFDTTEEGVLKIKMDVTNMDPAAYTGKMGVGLEQGGNNDGHAHNASVTGEDATVTVGNKEFAIQFGNPEFWGCPALFVTDKSAPSIEIGSAEVVEEGGKPVLVISGTYANYTDEQLEGMLTYFDLESNSFAANENWNVPAARYLVKGGTFAGAEGEWAYKVDLSAIDNFAYTVHFGLNTENAADLKFNEDFEKDFALGTKNYKLVSQRDNGDANDALIFWGLLGLYVYEEGQTKTYNITDLPEWIWNDDCVLFAWVWGNDEGAGAWKPVAKDGEDATKASFVASTNLKGFLLVRCVAGTETPDWSMSEGNEPGRIYNQSANAWRSPNPEVTSYSLAFPS